jgi:ribosomal protein L37E
VGKLSWYAKEGIDRGRYCHGNIPNNLVNTKRGAVEFRLHTGGVVGWCTRCAQRRCLACSDVCSHCGFSVTAETSELWTNRHPSDPTKGTTS